MLLRCYQVGQPGRVAREALLGRRLGVGIARRYRRDAVAKPTSIGVLQHDAARFRSGRVDDEHLVVAIGVPQLQLASVARRREPPRREGSGPVAAPDAPPEEGLGFGVWHQRSTGDLVAMQVDVAAEAQCAVEAAEADRHKVLGDDDVESHRLAS